MSDLLWTDERCKQLDQFERLIREVRSINSGSHCLERIARCIELADALDRWELELEYVGRSSFRTFLNTLAIADREGRASAKDKP